MVFHVYLKTMRLSKIQPYKHLNTCIVQKYLLLDQLYFHLFSYQIRFQNYSHIFALLHEISLFQSPYLNNSSYIFYHFHMDIYHFCLSFSKLSPLCTASLSLALGTLLFYYYTNNKKKVNMLEMSKNLTNCKFFVVFIISNNLAKICILAIDNILFLLKQ